MKDKKSFEIRIISQLALVVTVVVFSGSLIVLNLLLDWEHWPIPILFFTGAVSLFLYLYDRLPEKIASHLYSWILILDVFYYIVNMQSTTDCTAVIIISFIILALTQERWILWSGFFVSELGLLYALFMRGEHGGLIFDRSHIVRTNWQLVLVLAAAFVVESLLSIFRHIVSILNNRIAVLEKENQAASDFLTNVSHEIRTPINVAIGLTGIEMEEETNPRKQMRLASIHEASNRVAEQIDDIMDFSEIEMKRLTVNEEEYMLSSLLGDVVAKLQPYMKKGVEVVFDVESSIPAVMSSDAAKIKKMLWHLIVNGIKFTQEGGVYVHIGCEKVPYGVNLNMTVTDTGIGMDMRREADIFRRFYQVDSMRTRTSGGLGLGLPIIIGFLKEMGGFLYVDSTQGEGSTMRVTVPQKVVDEDECFAVDDPGAYCVGVFFNYSTVKDPNVREYYNRMIRHFSKGIKIPFHNADNIENLKRLVSQMIFSHLFTGAREYETYTDYIEGLALNTVVTVVADAGWEPRTGSRVHIVRKPVYCFPLVNVINNTVAAEETFGEIYLEGVRALVVDDEPMNLTVALGIFDRYGMEVTTADSGPTAIEICQKQKFDIIFMDHMMPEMDGVEAMKRIRADYRHKGVEMPFVALTANALSSAREMFLAEGFEGFVSKPIELPELERVLKKVLPTSLISYRSKEEMRKAVYGEEISPQEADGDFFDEIAKLGINPSNGMRYSENDREFYELLLQQYVEEAPEKIRKADRLLAEDNLTEYAVIAHSVKSTSRLIGASELSEKAMELEKAAKAGDRKTIDEKGMAVFEEYETLAKGIDGIISGNEKKSGNIQMMPQGATMFEFLPKGGETS